MREINTIVGLDLETTGLLSRGSSDWKNQPGIVQVGLVRIARFVTGDEWRITGKLETFIDPEIDEERWSPEAIEITGIGPEQVKDAPNLLMAHGEIAEFMVGADALLGYNIVEYDIIVLAYQLQRYSLQHNFPWPPRHIDLMRYAPHYLNRKGKRGIERPKLGALYEEIMGKPLEDAHGALNDIVGTAEVFIEMGALKGIGL